MSDEDRFYLLSFSRIDSTQRALIHQLVKRTTDEWWHQQENVWIVRGGKQPSEWRDRLAPFLIFPASVLVLSLPRTPSERGWASMGSGLNGPVAGEWLKRNYGPSSAKRIDPS